MKDIHPLLKRQIKKVGLDIQGFDDVQQQLLERVSRSYLEMDAERYTIQRSFELSSKEMDLLRKNLDEEKAYLRSVMSEGLITINDNWEVTSINAEGSRLLGLNEIALPVSFDKVLNLYHGESPEHQIDFLQLKAKLSQGETVESPRAFIKNNNNQFTPISYALNPLLSNESMRFRGAIVILRDTSEHIKFESALQEALNEAKRLNEAKTLFLANMSHEIRTPLNGVLGMLQILAKTELNDKQSEHVELAKDSAKNLLVIIDDILDFSKFDAGMVSFENRQFDLHEEFNSIVALFEPQFQKKGVELSCDIQANVPTHVETDSYRLRQLVFNLTSNALKFTPEQGKVQLSLSIDAEDSSQLKIIIQDTGLGISPAACEKLFDSFYQADQSTTRIFGGTGLGLAICKKIIDSIGGKITVESEEGKGSCFTFTYPFQYAQETGAGLPDNSHESMPTKSKILVVDDNELNLKVTKEMLEFMDCEVHLAHNGQEAIHMINDNDFDIVFMDCHMPVMDGYEAAKEIRKREHQLQIAKNAKGYTTVIALTANAFESSKDKCFACGMDDFLSKPFQMDELNAMLDKHKKAPNQNASSL